MFKFKIIRQAAEKVSLNQTQRLKKFICLFFGGWFWDFVRLFPGASRNDCNTEKRGERTSQAKPFQAGGNDCYD